MKKRILSSVVFVAFASTAFANTGEVKENLIMSKKLQIEVTSETNEDEAAGVNCGNYALGSTLAESQHYGIRMSQKEFASAYSFYYNVCVDAVKNKSLLLAPVFLP